MPAGRRDYWKSDYLAQLETPYGAKFSGHAATNPSPHTVMFLMHIGGALNSLPEDTSPVGNRDARYLYLLLGSWEKAEEDKANIDWVREAWSDLRPFSTGGTYLNSLSEDEGSERIQAALGKNLQRLAEIKRRWDPGNVFRTNRNILPAQ